MAATLSREALGQGRWVSLLASYVGDAEPPEPLDDPVVWLEDESPAEPPSTSSAPPPLWRPPPKAGSAGAALSTVARQRWLAAQERSLLDDDDLERLWGCLQQAAGGEGAGLDYDAFSAARESACEQLGPERVSPLFAASVFLRFTRDAYGRVGLAELFRYLTRRTELAHVRVQLLGHDADGDGALTEAELSDYVSELVPLVPALERMPREFLPRYTAIAARKLAFFSGATFRRGAKVASLLQSDALAELLRLQLVPKAEAATPQCAANWFSHAHAHSVHRAYLDLDRDMNGLLSPQELIGFERGGLTPIFVRRVFEEHAGRHGPATGRGSSRGRGAWGKESAAGGQRKTSQMDFPSYLDFVLAWRSKLQPQSLQYFFKVLDLNKRGFLVQADLWTFFREVHAKAGEAAQYIVVQDVIDELVDMVRPKDEGKITLEDIAESKMGDVFVTCLADAYGFVDYDQREFTMAEQHEDDEG